MKNLARASGVLLLIYLCFLFWFMVASDYGDSVVSGTYHLSQNGETSTLVLRPDHSFEQELNRSGKTEHAEGHWRRLGEAGISFSKEFIRVSGQEMSPDGTAFGDLHKRLGLLISLALRQYHVLRYGRIDSSSDKTVSGTYVGDEPGVPTTLVLEPDHTFEQTVSHFGVVKHAKGSWGFSQNGDIIFSKAFLKTSGESLREDETASAWNPKGSNLQIEIAVTSKSGVPTFHKRQFSW
jgi:hypothetical protein